LYTGTIFEVFILSGKIRVSIERLKICNKRGETCQETFLTKNVEISLISLDFFPFLGIYYFNYICNNGRIKNDSGLEGGRKLSKVVWVCSTVSAVLWPIREK
jgi:hypothetical protein